MNLPVISAGTNSMTKLVAGPVWVPAAVAAALVAAALWRFGLSGFAVVAALVAVPATGAAWTDLRESRLPVPLTTAAIGCAAVGVAALGVAEPEASVRALAAGVLVTVLLVLVGGATNAFAFGDVLLAAPFVMLCGYWGWSVVGAWAVLVPVVALPAAVFTVVRHRSMSGRLPMGPALVAAALVALGVSA